MEDIIMIGMDFISFIILLGISVVVSLFLHYVLKYYVKPGLNSFIAKVVLGWIGAWLGTIMLFNVWAIIWPKQKMILGLDGKEHSTDEIAKAKVVALMASRINTALSVPMLLSMTGFAHGLHF